MLITINKTFWFLIKVLHKDTFLKLFKTDCRKKCLSLDHNRANSYLFINGTEIDKFRANDSEINPIPLCLGSFSEDFPVHNMKKTWFYEYVYDCSVDNDATAVDDILHIHKYLMKKNNIWAIR